MAHRPDFESDALSSNSASALYDNLRESIRVAQNWGLDAREVFEAYDEDHSGEISFKEFTYAVKELGLHYVNNSKPLRLAMAHTPFFSHSTQRIKYRDLLIDCLSPETYGKLPSFADYKVRESLARLKSAVEHKGVQQVFNFFDRQEQGYIDRVSFRQGLQKMGINLSNVETRSLMRFFEKPGSPLINLRRFAEVFHTGSSLGTSEDADGPLAKLRHRVNLAVRARRTSYEYIFHLFDTNQDGFISIQELSKGFHDLGIEDSIHEFTKAFKAYMDVDGRLSYDQFVRAISPEFVENPLDRLRVLIETTRRHKSITHEQVFDFFRKEKQEVLSVTDLLQGFNTLDISTDKETVTKAFRTFFSANSETLTFSTFVDAIQNARKDRAMTPLQKIQHRVKQYQDKQKLSDKDIIRIVDAAAKTTSQKGVNAKGEIPFDAVVKALRDMEVKIDIAKITSAFEPFTSSNGFVSYVQVLRLLLHDYLSDPLELLRMLKRRRDFSDKDLFKAFDVHKKGRITLRDLQHTLAQMGSQQSLDRIKSSFAQYLDESQTLSFSQFKQALQGGNPAQPGVETAERMHQNVNDMIRALRRRVEEAFVAHQMHIKEFIECFGGSSDEDTLTIDAIVSGFTKLNIEIDGQVLSKALEGFLHANTNSISKKDFLAACIPQYHESLMKEDSQIDVTLTTLCRHILSALKRGVSLEECFKHFVQDDFVQDEDKKISKNAFAAGLLRLDMSLKENEINSIVRKFGIGEKSEFIDFEGFKTMVKTYAVEERHLEELIEQIRLIVTNAHSKGVDYVNCFQHFDTDHSGVIDREEFQSGISRLGLTLTDAQIGCILRKYGSSKKGQLGISYNNFLSILGVRADSRQKIIATFKRLRLKLFLVRSSIAEMKKRFNQADTDNTGCCSRESFLEVLRQTGFELSNDTMHTLLHYFDPKADGVVDYRHFWGLLQPKDVTKILQEAVHKLRRSMLEDSAFEMQRLVAAFKHFDLKGDGLITKREFRCGIHALRFKFRLSTEETETVCDVFDFNDKSRVDSNSFVDFLLKLSGRHSSEIKENVDNTGAEGALEQELVEFVEMAEEMNIPLEETFKQFDPNSNGVVTFEEFQTTLYKLGFPVDPEHLKAILVRINAQEAADPSRPACREQVLYADFLAYFRRQAGLVKTCTLTDEEMVKETHKVIEACRQHAKLLLSHGQQPTTAFAKFDQQGTGNIPLSSFKEAFRATFHPHVKAPPSVLDKIMNDFTKDGHLVSYVAFFGMKLPSPDAGKYASTWQQVFSKSRKRREALLVKGIAKGIIDLILECMEKEIESKGPIWRQARKHISRRVNNATFINRNKASVSIRSNSNSKPRVSRMFTQRTEHGERKSEKAEEIKREEALQGRRKVLAAEEVASRLIQETTIREEEMALQQQIKSLEQDAIDHACKRIDNKIVFPTGKQANLFLSSIGLGRFAKNDRDSERVEYCVKDDQKLKDAIGTFSTIIARKIKRELLLLLRRNLDLDKVIRSQPDPASWSVMQAAVYIKDLGFSVKPFLDNRLDGPTLLQLTVNEATSELGLLDLVAAQSLVFCMALIHYLSQHTASKMTAVGDEPICSALRLEGSTLARPSSAPIREWTAEDVEQLISNLGLETERFTALSIDGPALLDLSEKDLTQELKLSIVNTKKVLHLIQILRQPPWLCLGTGPYLELGMSLTESVNQRQLYSFDQDMKCLVLPSNRDNSFFVKIRPGLKVAMDAVATELKEATDTSPYQDATKTVEILRSRVVEHIAKVKAAGLDIEKPFLERDSLKQGSLSTYAFIEALKLTGFDVSNYPATTVLSYLDTFQRGQVRYKDVIKTAEFPVETHNLVFDRDATAAPIGLTADGTVATLFNPNRNHGKTRTAFVFPGTVVAVRYKGGSAKYDALVVRQNKDGTYVVEYLDKEQRSMNLEETVHQEWITVKDDENSAAFKKAGSFKPELAVSSTSFCAGVHTWTVANKHKSTGIGFGVCRRNRAKPRGEAEEGAFIGCTLADFSLEKGDIVRVKLDLFQHRISLTVERAGKSVKTKIEQLSLVELYGSIDGASRLKAQLRNQLTEAEKHISRLSIDGRIIHVDALRKAVRTVPGCEEVEAVTVDELAAPHIHTQLADSFDVVKFLTALRDQNDAIHEATILSPAVRLSSHGDTVQWKHEGKAETFEVEQQVLVRYGGGSAWYEATVKSKDDNKYVVEYAESGSVEQGVLAQNMKHKEIDDSTEKTAQSRLVLKLYCTVAEHTSRVADKPTSKKGRNAKGLKRKHKLSAAVREVKSFSSVGSKVASTLLRQRLLTDGYIHRLESSRHLAFSPHLVRDRNVTNEAGWTYVGQITYDELAHHCEYDGGISLVVNFTENLDLNVHFQRLCLMGVLYSVTPAGEQLCKAPIEPLKSVLSDVRFRGKSQLAYLEKAKAANEGSMATHFCILSKPFRTTTQRPTPPPRSVSLKPKRQQSVTPTPVDETHSKVSPRKTSPKGAERTLFLEEDDDNPDKSESSIGRDEEICIDRWLALNGLTEFGHEADSNISYKNSPILDPITGLRQMSRYEYIVLLHPNRPWQNIGISNRWLPEEEEKQRFESWVKATLPEVNTDRSKTQFEVVCSLYPSRPWLRRKKTWKSSKKEEAEARDRKYNQERRHRRAIRKNKKFACLQDRLNQEVAHTIKVVNSTLENLDEQERKVRILKANIEVASNPDGPSVSAEDARKASELLAEEARLRQKACFEAELAQEDQLQRMEKCQEKERAIREKQDFLKTKTDQLEEREKARCWADRVTMKASQELELEQKRRQKPKIYTLEGASLLKSKAASDHQKMLSAVEKAAREQQSWCPL